MNLAIVLRTHKGSERLMRLQVPDTLPRLFSLKSNDRKRSKTPPHYFIWLEQITVAHLSEIFPALKVIEAHPFRFIRDAVPQEGELDLESPFESVEESIRQLSIHRREFGEVTQVAIYKDMPETIRNLLAEILRIELDDFYIKGKPLGLRSLWQLYNNVNRDDLKYRYYKPAIPKVFRRASHPRDIFSSIRRENILLHHPYDAFSPVVDSIFQTTAYGSE